MMIPMMEDSDDDNSILMMIRVDLLVKMTNYAKSSCNNRPENGLKRQLYCIVLLLLNCILVETVDMAGYT